MRTIELDGLVWGASKLVPVGFGIKKLQVNLVVEDEKVSIDDLQAKIEEDEDHVQSTDVVSESVTSTLEHELIFLGCYAKTVKYWVLFNQALEAWFCMAIIPRIDAVNA